MNSREHIDLLIFLVKQLFQFANFSFQTPHTILQRLCVTSWKGSSTQLVTRFTFKSDIGTLRTGRADSIAAYLFASATITGLCYTALVGRTHPYHLHRKYARHIGDVV